MSASKATLEPSSQSFATTMFYRSLQTLAPLLALVAVILIFAALDYSFGSQKFASYRNVRTVTVQSCTVAVAALGMTVIIIAGGIDLSCGTAIALSATVLAWGLREDVGCLFTRGENFAGLSRQLEAAQSQAEKGGDQDAERDRARIESLRTRLIALLESKLPTQSAEQSPLQAKIAKLNEPAFRLRVDPTWLEGVPNARSTPWLAVALGMLTGVACGTLNGALISWLRVVPFIITLGTMTIYLGIGNWLSGNIPIRPSVKHQVPTWLASVISNSEDHMILGFPWGVWLAVVVSLLLAVVLRQTVFGRHVFALGSNEQTARLCGISVPWTKVAVYALGGLFVGLAGVYQFSRLTVGNPMSGRGLELQIIAAVVIGGGSLSGGRGTVLGTLAGAGIMAVIYSGCTLLGMDNATQDILLGAVIIGAVTLDQLRQRWSE